LRTGCRGCERKLRFGLGLNFLCQRYFSDDDRFFRLVFRFVLFLVIIAFGNGHVDFFSFF
jgi:hypothetical protein